MQGFNFRFLLQLKVERDLGSVSVPFRLKNMFWLGYLIIANLKLNFRKMWVKLTQVKDFSKQKINMMYQYIFNFVFLCSVGKIFEFISLKYSMVRNEFHLGQFKSHFTEVKLQVDKYEICDTEKSSGLFRFNFSLIFFVVFIPLLLIN